MVIDPATYNPADTALRINLADGSPIILTNPAAAAARLKALDADENVVAVLLDPQHPQHGQRTEERLALQKIATPPRTNTYSGPNPPDRARDLAFSKNVEEPIGATPPAPRY